MDRTVERFVHIDGPSQQRISRESQQRLLVARSDGHRVRVEALNDPHTVRETVRTMVVSGAEQGPRGAPGIVGGSVPPIHFSYGDAAGIRFVAPTNGTFTLARLDFETAFNGTGAAVKVGVIGNIEALMAAAASSPAVIARFEVVPDFFVLAGTGVWLEITPGVGASQGSGVLYLMFTSES
jgi:hypothetical protein